MTKVDFIITNTQTKDNALILSFHYFNIHQIIPLRHIPWLNHVISTINQSLGVDGVKSISERVPTHLQHGALVVPE